MPNKKEQAGFFYQFNPYFVDDASSPAAPFLQMAVHWSAGESKGLRTQRLRIGGFKLGISYAWSLTVSRSHGQSGCAVQSELKIN